MSRQDRMDLLNKIQDKRGSTLVSYITSDRLGLETKVSGDIFPMLHKHLSDINNPQKIDVFLYTPGGDIIAAFGFVNLFREFCKELNVIIPFKALSSGTLIALGANELVMTKMGQLSPIDPSVSHPLGPQIQIPENPNAYQILPVNVEDINAFFSLATDEAGLQDEESRRKVFEILASNVNPITLGAVQRSRQQISFLASTLMGYHMKDEDQIKKIVRILTRERFSHNANQELNPSRTCPFLRGQTFPTLKGRSPHAMDWQDKLIHLYVYICQQYRQKHLWFYTQRMSNNNSPTFTDEEVLTIYLFGLMQQHTQIKAIYTYTRDHLLAWFPHLPTYSGYLQRLNRLSAVFTALLEQIQKDAPTTDVCQATYLVDSMPIVMAQAARSDKACVAKQELSNKGRCASKRMWYYGVKLHIVAQSRKNGLPKPDFIGLTGAAEHDLTALRHLLPVLRDGHLYGDRIYSDQPLKDTLHKEQNLILETPVKRKQGQESLTEAEKDFSRAVSRIRQPIEALFSWIEQKTNISMASRVRSYEGLLVHVFGRLTAACFLLAFYS